MPDFAQPTVDPMISTAPLVGSGNRLYILAGTSSQAAHFARTFGLQQKDVQYVIGEHSIRGMAIEYWVVVGTFWSRGDAVAIWRALQAAVTRLPHPVDFPMLPHRFQPTPAPVVVSPLIVEPEEEPLVIDPDHEERPAKRTTIQRVKRIRDC